MKHNQVAVEQRITIFMERKARQFKGLDTFAANGHAARQPDNIRLPMSNVSIPVVRMKMVGA